VARSGPIARRQILIQLDDARLRIALARLAEQDALIDVRQDDSRGELSVSLYGEVRAAIGAVLTALSRLGGAVGTPSL
jgi:ribosomal protection tetracycline resistance protein